ncbi:MAG TPA: serine/threonine-protein kinase [Elusimicrobiota bacterium]|nr:serine/threonine-protein kinase [Elusimicrobiota bacterium]
MSESEPEKTQAQLEAEIAASKELSLPKEAEQHAAAPKIAGYILTQALGRGAFAEVWKAWQIRTRKQVAIKVFTQRKGVNWLFLQREVERLVTLDKHPHIVSLLDADLTGDPAYYAMDFLAAGSLERFVDPANPAPVGEAARWMEEVAQALAYVHSKGLIHCDLKPANILLDEGGHIRVADFGQSRIVTDSAGALGTLFYMAPEQAAVAKEGEPVRPDVRWDVYGLGAAMWAVLSGRAPHGGEEDRRFLESLKTLDEKLALYREIVGRRPLEKASLATGGNVDEDLSAIVGQCVLADAARRYAGAAEVLADLKARRETRPVGPLRSGGWYRIRKFLERNAVAPRSARLCFIFLGLLLAIPFRTLRQKMRAQSMKSQIVSFASAAKEIGTLKKEKNPTLARLSDDALKSELRGLSPRDARAREIQNELDIRARLGRDAMRVMMGAMALPAAVVMTGLKAKIFGVFEDAIRVLLCLPMLAALAVLGFSLIVLEAESQGWAAAATLAAPFLLLLRSLAGALAWRVDPRVLLEGAAYSFFLALAWLAVFERRRLPQILAGVFWPLLFAASGAYAALFAGSNPAWEIAGAASGLLVILSASRALRRRP